MERLLILASQSSLHQRSQKSLRWRLTLPCYLVEKRLDYQAQACPKQAFHESLLEFRCDDSCAILVRLKTTPYACPHLRNPDDLLLLIGCGGLPAC